MLTFFLTAFILLLIAFGIAGFVMFLVQINNDIIQSMLGALIFICCSAFLLIIAMIANLDNLFN